MSSFTIGGPVLPADLDAEVPSIKAAYADRRAARQLIDRLTFGFTQQEAAHYARFGPSGYLEYHLNHTAIDDSVLDAFLAANYPALPLTPKQLSTQTDVTNQLIRARLMRAAFSKRQLFERAVEMWTDHFNIYIREDNVSYLKAADDRDVIRANALGTFPNMLRASAHSTAMLIYLNNDTNRVGAPNENYARELMELHSLGVDGGYTQTDVQQVAKCFTGWTYQPSSAGDLQWSFRFNASNHDQTQKIVLGNIIPANGGQQDGETVLNILAAHPSTARFIAKKMLTAFWGYNPSATLIDSLAAVYSSTGGDIKAMLRHIFTSPSVPPRTPKFKRPMHLLISAIRGLNAEVTQPNNLQSPIARAGHGPFDWVPPDGYPDDLVSWTSLLLPRWNFGASLLNNEWFNNTTQQGVRVNDVTLLAGAPNTAVGVVDRLNEVLMNGQMPTSDRDRLLAYLPANAPSTTQKREVIGLAVSTPAFQWY